MQWKKRKEEWDSRVRARMADDGKFEGARALKLMTAAKLNALYLFSAFHLN